MSKKTKGKKRRSPGTVVAQTEKMIERMAAYRVKSRPKTKGSR